MESVYRHELVVGPEVVDGNGHVNNVAYVQWMQDAAIAHATAAACTELTDRMGATWVARRHEIEYFRPAYAGDGLLVLTWVANFRKVRSLRRYKIVRTQDNCHLASGATDWVFVDARTGRPRPIPIEIPRLFCVLRGRT